MRLLRSQHIRPVILGCAAVRLCGYAGSRCPMPLCGCDKCLRERRHHCQRSASLRPCLASQGHPTKYGLNSRPRLERDCVALAAASNGGLLCCRRRPRPLGAVCCTCRKRETRRRARTHAHRMHAHLLFHQHGPCHRRLSALSRVPAINACLSVSWIAAVCAAGCPAVNHLESMHVHARLLEVIGSAVFKLDIDAQLLRAARPRLGKLEVWLQLQLLSQL